MSEASSLILIAMLALMLWVLLFTAYLAYRRFSAVAKKEIDGRFFAIHRGYEEPAPLAKLSRHYANLYENPVIFYALCLAVLVAGAADMVFAYLAWAYVAARVVHSLIHGGYNNINHRFVAFLLSIGLIAAMIIRLLLRVA